MTYHPMQMFANIDSEIQVGREIVKIRATRYDSHGRTEWSRRAEMSRADYEELDDELSERRNISSPQFSDASACEILLREAGILESW